MSKKAMAKVPIKEQVNALTTADLLKMDVGLFCMMRERADAAGRKRLDYLLDRAHLEETIRGICREEMAKVGLVGGKK